MEGMSVRELPALLPLRGAGETEEEDESEEDFFESSRPSTPHSKATVESDEDQEEDNDLY